MRPTDIIPFLDLTSLGDDDTEADILDLCDRAHTPFGHVAALCVYPKFVSLCKQQPTLPVATVINFPHGTDTLEKVFIDTKSAVDDGADEIDLVIPYKSVIETQGSQKSFAHIRDIIHVCQNAMNGQKLKVIVESGAFEDKELLTRVCETVLECNVDFLKTSTGKIPTGATPMAVEIFVESIKVRKEKTGIKISGGVKTYDQALTYIEIIRDGLGDEFLKPETFRIGASSLLTDLLKNS